MTDRVYFKEGNNIDFKRAFKSSNEKGKWTILK